MKAGIQVPSNSFKVAGVGLLAAGELDAEGKMDSVVVKDEARRIYRKLVLKDHRIVGAMLLGDTRGKEEVQRAIQFKKDISPWEKELSSDNFDSSKLK